MTPNTIDFNSLSKKQLVELVIAKYNDCFRLEQENKKLKWLQICWKTVAEWIEDDKKVIRE